MTTSPEPEISPRMIFRGLRDYASGLDLDAIGQTLGLERKRSRGWWSSDESDSAFRRRCEIAFLDRYKLVRIKEAP